MPVESVDGLLGVQITPQVQQVEMYYLPSSFVVGTIISAITIVLMGGWQWQLQRLPRKSLA